VYIYNVNLQVGRTIVCGTNVGIHARTRALPTLLTVTSTDETGGKYGPFSVPMEPAELLAAARAGLHTYTHILTHTHIDTHTHSCTHAHHTHTQTHAHKHKHIYTYAHTYSMLSIQQHIFLVRQRSGLPRAHPLS